MSADAAPSADAARARFAAATAEHLSGPLVEGVSLRSVDHATLQGHMERMWGEDPRPHARIDRLYSAEQSARFADLQAIFTEPLTHRIVVEEGGEVIGGYWGMQESYGRYYMINSIVRPDRRGRGIYAALLRRVVAAVAATGGFNELWSRHRVDNNAILVPKLKAGFVITGFEVAPKFGLLVHLRRFLVPEVARAYEFRVDGSHRAALGALGFFPDDPDAG